MLPALHRFFIYSNLFIAVCAILMADQTFRVLLHHDAVVDLLGFIFFSTLASYSFHWYLTSGSVIPSPRMDWLQRHRNVHIILFFAGIAGAAFFFFSLLPYFAWLLIAALVTFLYSAPKIPHRYFRLLRRVAIGKTIFLAFVWMYVTTVLPILVSGQRWNEQYVLFVINRFFLIYAICILFDYRDREDDRIAGVKSLITWLSEKNITLLFIFSLSIFFISTFLLANYGYPLSDTILLCIPGIITACLYDYAKRHFSDMLYYFVLDGLMALSALLMLLARI